MQHAACISSRAALIGKSAEVGTKSEVGFRSSSQGYTAFMRHVLGISDEERQQRREQVLSTTIKDFRCASLSCDHELDVPDRSAACTTAAKPCCEASFCLVVHTTHAVTSLQCMVHAWYRL